MGLILKHGARAKRDYLDEVNIRNVERMWTDLPRGGFLEQYITGGKHVRHVR